MQKMVELSSFERAWAKLLYPNEQCGIRFRILFFTLISASADGVALASFEPRVHARESTVAEVTRATPRQRTAGQDRQAVLPEAAVVAHIIRLPGCAHSQFEIVLKGVSSCTLA